MCVFGASIFLAANRPLSWLLLSGMSSVLFFVYGIARPKTLSLSWPLLSAFVLYSLSLAWCVYLSTQNIDDTFSTWLYLPRSIAYAFLAILGYCFAQYSQKTLQWFSIWSGILALYGLTAYATGVNPVLGEQEFYASALEATFVSRNAYALYAGWGCIVSLCCIKVFLRNSGYSYRGSTVSRLVSMTEDLLRYTPFYLISFALCFCALVLTQSRAGIVLGLIGLFVFSLLSRRTQSDKKNKGRLPKALGLACLLGFVALISISPRLAVDGLESGRYDVYVAIVHAISQNLWDGYGLGSFLDAFRPFVPTEMASVEWNTAHSVYLETVFDRGIIGSTVLFSSLLILLIKAIQNFSGKRAQKKIIHSCLLGCLLTGILHAGIDPALQMPAVTSVFALFLGMAVKKSDQSE